MLLGIKFLFLGVFAAFMGIVVAASTLGPYSIPLAALVVSLSTIVYSVVSFRHSDSRDLVGHLYTRIEDLEGQVEILERHAAAYQDQIVQLNRKTEELERENFMLMRKLLRMEDNETS